MTTTSLPAVTSPKASTVPLIPTMEKPKSSGSGLKKLLVVPAGQVARGAEVDAVELDVLDVPAIELGGPVGHQPEGEEVGACR